MTSREERLLTVREVAQRTSCHPDTVRKWVRAGTVGAVRVGPHGTIRIPQAEASRLVRICVHDDSRD